MGTEVHFAEVSCFVPSPPGGESSDYLSQSLVLSSGDFKLLNCGSKGGDNQRVIEYDPKIGEWKNHSQLSDSRQNSIGITMPNGVYLFGGWQKPFERRHISKKENREELVPYSTISSELLPRDQGEWIMGPSLVADELDDTYDSGIIV